jgi:hypothetical protein
MAAPHPVARAKRLSGQPRRTRSASSQPFIPVPIPTSDRTTSNGSAVSRSNASSPELAIVTRCPLGRSSRCTALVNAGSSSTARMRKRRGAAFGHPVFASGTVSAGAATTGARANSRPKGRALIRDRVHVHLAAQSLDNAKHRGQSETCAVIAFGGKERLEDAALNFGGHPNTVVNRFDDCPLLTLPGRAPPGRATRP